MKPALTIVAAGPDLRTVFEKLADRIDAQAISGALSEAEAAGARWANETLEAMLAVSARKHADSIKGDLTPAEFAGFIEAARGAAAISDDDISDLTFGSVRGG